jgi:hypothetical protein
MDVLFEDDANLHVKLTVDDITQSSGNPHFRGLRDEARDLLLGTCLDAYDKPYAINKELGVVIAKEIHEPFCIPACGLGFLRGETGARPTVAYTNCTVVELDVHQMLGVYCSYYLSGPSDIFGAEAIVPVPCLTVCHGKVDRLTVGCLTLDEEMLDTPNAGKVEVTGVSALRPVLDGPQVIESVEGKGALFLGPRVVVPINLSPYGIRMERRNPDIAAHRVKGATRLQGTTVLGQTRHGGQSL